MDTAAIKSPITALNGTTTKASTTEASSPDTSFDHVLSREMTDRKSTDATTNQQTSSKNDNATPTRPAEESKSDDDTADAKQSENGTDATTPWLVLVAELNAAKNEAGGTATTITAPSADSSNGSQVSLELGSKSDSTVLTSIAGLQNARQAPAIKVITSPETKGIEQNPSEPTAKTASFSNMLHPIGNAKLTQQTSETPAARQSAEPIAAIESDTAAVVSAAKAAASTTIDTIAGNNKSATTEIKDLTTNAAAMAPVQQAALHISNATENQSEKLTQQVGTSEWNQALGQKVVWMLSNEVQSASLTLNPPDLGPLQVVLNVSNNQANASFVATQPEVRQALEAALPKLREMLGDAGIQLGQANVSAGAQQQQGSFSGQQQASSSIHPVSENNFRSSTTTTSGIQAVRQGLVDTFV